MAFDLGLERAGMVCKWQVENDPFCLKVLAKHWPKVKRFGDVKTLTGHELAAVDLLCGGFPCQPVSTAGQRKGAADDRWLWPEFYRIICAVRPRWVVVENVPGLLSADAGRLFGGILRDLAAGGYNVEWDCFRASDFGVPQDRDRIFFAAYSTRIGPFTVFHQDAKHASRHPARLYGPSRVAAYLDDEDYRARPLPVLGNFKGAAIPYRERSGADDGIPDRVDRLRSLGNAVVPQVAEWIGRQIVAAEKMRRCDG